ncbi:MAG TPA: galactosyltransferase-related protein [bacterium]|nr:galactosyltransferase-related protein [bacterium]HOL48322.1 galactosyltransferase-related protein [bacterium]HPQ18552.1 galactosyltransferase-related protein [bacterium]
MISIIIAYRNRKDNLLVNLNQIKKNLNNKNFEIELIIIDLGSNENLTEILKEYKFVKYYYINYRGIYCKSWAFNIGFKKSKFDWIFLLDVDCVFFDNFFSLFFNNFNSDKINSFYSFTIKALNKEISDYIISKKNITQEVKELLISQFEKIFTLSGVGNLVIHRSMFERLNGFDEKFIGWGREDSDFYNRLLLAGYNLIIMDNKAELALYHLYHDRDMINYCNSLILFQNDKIENYNKEKKIIKVNQIEEWGEEKNLPDQYRYEKLIKFEIEKNQDNVNILKVNDVYFNSKEEPFNYPAQYEKIDEINTNNLIIILGGGLNYLANELLRVTKKIIIIERYKRIIELNKEILKIEQKNFFSLEFNELLVQLCYLKNIKEKNIIYHKIAYNYDYNWYNEIYNFLIKSD